MSVMEIPRTKQQLAGVVYRLKHKDEIAEKKRARQKREPEVRRARGARRRVRIQANMTKEDCLLSRLYRLAIKHDPCFYCGETEGIMHDDHYHAIARGGTDRWFNLVRACAHCNLSKNAMHGDDFLRLINPVKAAALKI
jgi:5-methylcytosine-specific restriction endonuclease McrA